MDGARDRDERVKNPIPPEDMLALRNVGRRRELETCETYRRWRLEIERLTFALERGRPAAPASRPEASFFRAVTWNIERGNHLDAIKAFLAAESRIASCDVLLLNEVDIGMARSGNRNVAGEIAELLGFEHVFGNSYLCLSHGDVRDGRSSCDNAVGLHGNAIVSRHPIVRAENVSVAITKDKFESSEKRLGHKKALVAQLDTRLGPLCVAAVHLDPYASPAQRRAQMKDALDAIDRFAGGMPTLLGGDLNTTTYDLESLPRLFWNVAAKLWRGGFPHAIDHYMRPHELYERGVFEELHRHGFSFEEYNDMMAGSVRYEVGTFHSESKVRDHLPPLFVEILRRKLRPWNGVAPLKIDWFAGRGVEVVGAGERLESSGRASLSPMIFERARWKDEALSDHDPVLVDVSPARAET